jgi:ribosomal protein S18 acetylase RimI-like enzyme
MNIILREVLSDEADLLVSILLAADEDEERVRTQVADPRFTAYMALLDEVMIGAALLCWQEDESEVEYIAVAEHLRGHGYGKSMMAALVAEARRRGIRSLLIGTDNTAFDTIAFYQKCGFRMDFVRRDYFSYIQPPIVNNGIVLRDMLVLRYTLA